MRSDQPPAVATWLLKQFGCSPQNEAILGDLIEQYRNGRHSLWYWRQIVTAIAVSSFREVWRQKTRTLAALSAGWIIFAFYRSPLDRPLFQSISLQINFASMQFQIPPNWWIYCGMYVLLLSFISAIMGLIVGAFSGWIVAKFQPSHRVPIVLMFVTFLCGYWLFSLSFSIVKSGLVGVGIVPGHEIRSLLFLPFSLLPWVASIVGIFWGGGLLEEHQASSCT